MKSVGQRLTRKFGFTLLALTFSLSLPWLAGKSSFFLSQPAAAAAAPMADEDVRWTSLVNTTATGNTIRKTGGFNDGRYDGSGVSHQSITNNGFYEFTYQGTDVEHVTGLTDTPSNNAPRLARFLCQPERRRHCRIPRTRRLYRRHALCLGR